MWQDKSGAGRCCNLKPPICAKHSYYKQITSLNTHLLLEIKSWRLYLAILAGDQVACVVETAMTIPWLMEIETINPAITKWFEWIIASLLNCYKIFMSNLLIKHFRLPDSRWSCVSFLYGCKERNVRCFKILSNVIEVKIKFKVQYFGHSCVGGMCRLLHSTRGGMICRKTRLNSTIQFHRRRVPRLHLSADM